MGSALLNQTSRDEAEQQTTAPAAASHDALRHQVAERLAAHRARRARTDPETSHAAAAQAPAGDAHKTRIAAAVAERYAQAQSYRAFLAAEAERAVQQARAAAEVAATNAAAVAEAQQHLLDRLALEQQPEIQELHTAGAEPMLWPELDQSPAASIKAPAAPPSGRPRGQKARETTTESTPATDLPTQAATHGALRVVLYEELSRSPQDAATPPRHDRSRTAHAWDDAEFLALDEEISFRHAPVFEEPAGPPTALPANLIEFPRQLIASRKARPRYAEGPLRDEDAAAPKQGSQLRIFEVDPAQISTVPGSAEPVEAPMPQWTSLWLETPAGAANAPHASHHTATHHEDHADTLPYSAPPARPYTAAYPRRALAGAIDSAIIAAATFCFAATCTAIVGYLAAPEAGWSIRSLAEGAVAATQGVPLASELTAVAVAIGALAVTYQILFFTFSEATPGMRLLRIGLCTFADDNPSRRAMRLRILALILSTVTLGLGHLWAILDEDRLTWHDLITRMYPRSY